MDSSCPFATWNHRKGTDKKPSFGISLATDGSSRYRCFGCGAGGELNVLLWRLESLRGGGKWFARASELVMAHDSPSLDEIELLLDFESPAAARRREFKRNGRGFFARAPKGEGGGGAKTLSLDHIKYDTLPESTLTRLQDLPQEALDYLTGPRRHLNELAVRLWGLRWDAGKRRVIIPIRDWKGKLVATTGRCLDQRIEPLRPRDRGLPPIWGPEQQPKFLHSKGFKRDFFLFGEHLVKKGEMGILVEGHFDAIYLRTVGYSNAVAVMGSHLSRIQVEKALKMFSEVVIFPDGDEAGGLAAERWEHAFKGRTPVRVLTVETGRDPDDYDLDELDYMFIDDS